MAIFDTCIRAFVKGNLGDDLFIITLCKRYPKTRFVLCGEKKYRRLFGSLPNLRYISKDAFFPKWLLRFRNVLGAAAFYCSLKGRGGEKYTRLRWNDVLAKHSRHNVLISGSIFMELTEGTFSPGGYYKLERAYFARHPYVIGCNFGPYHSRTYREFYEECFRDASAVCFRESYSAQLFEKQGLPWAPDILFQVNKRDTILPARKNYVLISVVNVEKDAAGSDGSLQAGYRAALERLVAELLERGEWIVLAGFCREQGDNEVAEELLRRFPGHPKLSACLYPDVDYRQMLGYIAHAKAVVASRYHAMILGWLWGKKVLPVIYSDKMLHVLQDLAPKADYVTAREWMEEQDCMLRKFDKILYQASGIYLAKAVKDSANHFEKLDEILRR